MTAGPKTSAALSTALGIAAAALACVRRGQALDDALRASAPGLAAPERAAAQDISYSACRRLNLLDALASALMKTPNPAVDDLLRVALSELIDHPERAHTIVDQAVTAAAAVANGTYKPLVNGVLRSFLRERDVRLQAACSNDAVRRQYPAWWIARVRAAWPAQWEAILEAGNQRATMTLRVNARSVAQKKSTAGFAAGDVPVEAFNDAVNHPANFARALQDAGIAAQRSGESAFTLSKAQPAARVPGFADGRVSVQDLGAQWAAQLLDVQPGMRVLDACAAPGGKTAHLLERADCHMLALDRDVARLDTVRANLRRLGLTADCRAADASLLDTWWRNAPDAWWHNTQFDRVLLDAPCTASGVIARHPDGKWLKRERDIAALARQQAQLLDALWRVLKPGGKLLYATCSVFPEENTRQIDAFLSGHPDARQLNLPFDDIYPLLRVGGQLLPCAAHGGFYYALLEKPLVETH